MEAERWHLYVKEKKRIVKTEEGYIFYKNVVNGSKSYAIKILKTGEVARAINAKELQVYSKGNEIFSNAFLATTTIPIKAMNHFYNEREANFAIEEQRQLFKSNPKSAVSTYVIKNYILKNKTSKTGRISKYIKNRFNGIKLYFSVVDCDRTGEAHLHMYFITGKTLQGFKRRV